MKIILILVQIRDSLLLFSSHSSLIFADPQQNSAGIKSLCRLLKWCRKYRSLSLSLFFFVLCFKHIFERICSQKVNHLDEKKLYFLCKNQLPTLLQ